MTWRLAVARLVEIYNLRDRKRSGQLADLVEIDRAEAARVGIIDRLHQ